MSDRIETPADAGREHAVARAAPDTAVILSDDALGTVAGGRVKTSDRQQKAVLDFIKG
jgi:hypothetical protein